MASSSSRTAKSPPEIGTFTQCLYVYWSASAIPLTYIPMLGCHRIVVRCFPSILVLAHVSAFSYFFSFPEDEARATMKSPDT